MQFLVPRPVETYYIMTSYIKNFKYHIENIIILLINNLGPDFRMTWNKRKL